MWIRYIFLILTNDVTIIFLIRYVHSEFFFLFLRFQLPDLNIFTKENLFTGEAGMDGQFFEQFDEIKTGISSKETLIDALERMTEELHNGYSKLAYLPL
jgi:hypothetical protein